MQTSAEVVRIEADTAFVRPTAFGSCGVCAGKGGCEASSLLRLFSRSDPCYAVLNTGEAKVGDHVLIGIPDGTVWRSAALTYGMPLAGLLAGAVVGGMMLAQYPDFGAAVGALGGFMASAAFLRRVDTRFARLVKIQPVAGADRG